MRMHRRDGVPHLFERAPWSSPFILVFRAVTQCSSIIRFFKSSQAQSITAHFISFQQLIWELGSRLYNAHTYIVIHSKYITRSRFFVLPHGWEMLH